MAHLRGLSEAYHLLRESRGPGLREMLLRKAVAASFAIDSNVEPVTALLRKYSSVPMSFAGACLVRMSEILPIP